MISPNPSQIEHLAAKPSGREEGRHGKESASARIRPELNIEKWAGLWRPAHSQTPTDVRTLSREYTTPDGSRLKAKVEIGFSHLGGLTTEDQKTYYALVKQWEISGHSPNQIYFSVRGLARILHKKWGTNVINAITSSLRRLRATPITWENAYFDAGRRETIAQIDTLNIISELKIIRRKVDGRVTKEAGYFRFNDFTLSNLLNRHTKPVLFETILRFRMSLAQLLYTHLDLVMADKKQYQHRTRDLCEDLDLRGSEYGRVFERKRAFSKAIGELRGTPLTSGAISEIKIERTVDGTDYKLIVRKGSRSAVYPEEPDIAKEITPKPSTTGPTGSHDIVRHFHRIFHNVEISHPQSKELAQATTLVARYGFGCAKYVVDFARAAAGETKYRPQTFGGILQYADRAAIAYDSNRRQEEARAKLRADSKAKRDFEALHVELAEKRHAQAEARLLSLPPNDRENLRAKVRSQLLASPWVKESSPVFENVLHRAMVSEIIRQMGE